MLLKIVSFVVIECLTFVVVAVGAFFLARLGLALIGRFDTFLSRESHRPSKVRSGNR